jgi:hypothetical protein
MTSPTDFELLPPSGDGARLPALGTPELSTDYLARIKEVLEILTGRRGASQWDRAVTFRDLYRMGVTAGGGFGGMAASEAIQGDATARRLAAFEQSLRSSAAFRELQRAIGSADDLAVFPEEFRVQLQQGLADVARQRQADIQTIERKVQNSQMSLASRLTEVTAALDQTAAGVRDFNGAFADANRAMATSLKQVTARLNDVGGVTIEEKFIAQADAISGLLGQWSIKIQSGTDANPVIAGIALSVEGPDADSTTSSLVFLADKFGFFTAAGAVMPFGIDGTTGNVYVNGALLVNAGGTSLDAMTAGMINYVGDFASAPTATDYRVNDVYKNTTDQNSYILQLVSGVKTWTLFLPKGATGGTGASAKTLSLSSTSQIFQIPKLGFASPTSVTLSASPQNLGGSPTWSILAGTATLAPVGGNAWSKTVSLASMSTDTVTIQVAQDGLTDQITLAKIREGADAITAFLTNEAANVAADSAGVVASFAAAGGTFKLFEGIVDKTGDAAVTYSLAASSGVTISIASTGVYTVTAMSADSGSATLRAGYKGNFYDKIYTIAKSKAGATGANAKMLTALASAQVIRVAKDGTMSPSSITFNAVAANLSGTPSFTIAAGSTTLSAGGDAFTKVMAASAMTSDSVTIRIDQDGLFDQITVAKIREGSDALTGFLTNEAANVAAASDGTVSSFSTAGGSFKLFEGLTDVSGATGVTYSVASSSSGLTIAIDSAGDYTITALSSDMGSATLRAVYKGVTIDKVYTIAKAKAGTSVTGATGPRGTVDIATSGTSWSDATAAAAIAGAGYGSPQNRDRVTISGGGFVETRFYSSGSWLVMDAFINGNLLVSGTLACSDLVADYVIGLSYRTADTGQRVTINDGGDNSVVFYDSGGTQKAQIGGSGGSIACEGGSSIPGLYASSGSLGTAAILSGSVFTFGTHFTSDVEPLGDNAYNCGSASNAWSGIYSTTALNVTSDQRAKDGIEDSDLGLDFILALRPVSYRLKVADNAVLPDPHATGPFLPGQHPTIRSPRAGVRRHYGFLAQQVKAALGPRDAALWGLADRTDPDSLQHLRPEELIAPLVKAVQQQQARNDALERRLAAMEAKFAVLEAKLNGRGNSPGATP